MKPLILDANKLNKELLLEIKHEFLRRTERDMKKALMIDYIIDELKEQYPESES